MLEQRAVVRAGSFVVGAAGFAVIACIRPGSPLALCLVGAGVLAAGLVAVMTLVTDLVLGLVPPERAGSASALLETGSEFGGALGIALLGSIATTVCGARLHTSMAGPQDGLAGALAAAAGLPAPAARQLVDAARAAFLDGLDVVAVVGTAVLLVTARLAVKLLARMGESAP